MSSNTQDRLLALQAADLALRDAESDIYGSGTAPRNLEAGRIPGVVSTGLSHFSFDCDEDGVAGSADDGLCYNGPAGYPAPIWTTANIMNAAPSVAYGTFTGAVPIVGLSAQPRYLIEGFRKQSPGSYGPVLYYRITARAQGANPNTVVWLQEIFR
jgi:type IV pilus assembly protein PilX